MSDMRNEFDEQNQGQQGGNTMERDRVTKGEIEDTDDTALDDSSTEIDEDDTEESGG